MKEYRILFDYKPGTKTQTPEHVFVELEDETGKSIGAGEWEGHPQVIGKLEPVQDTVPGGGLVYLVLPAPNPAIRKALVDAKAAIESLDADALGMEQLVTGNPGEHYHIAVWSLRDELLDKINKALDTEEVA